VTRYRGGSEKGDQRMSDQDKFLLYTVPDGAVRVDVFFKEETVWLTQKALAELFAVKVPAINKHLKNIFESGELVEASVISILETTATDGKNYQTRYYNLDAIIAVGYRVNSYQATQFRIWATKTLREFIIKGFVMDVRGNIHTNTVEGYFSIFKRGLTGVYQHVSPKHFKRYLGEFDFRYNNRTALGVNDTERADNALKGIGGKRLTYRRTGAGEQPQV